MLIFYRLLGKDIVEFPKMHLNYFNEAIEHSDETSKHPLLLRPNEL